MINDQHNKKSVTDLTQTHQLYSRWKGKPWTQGL